MRLVVELDDLAAIGRAVIDVPPALELVERMIGKSPSLADLMGEASGDVDPPSVDELLDETLTEEWQSTSELLSYVGCDRTTLRSHLQRLEDKGKVEHRCERGRAYEWRLRSDR